MIREALEGPKMNIQDAIACLKANGYRVSKPRAQVEKPKLNALGLPHSEQYDPNYKMRYHTPPLKRAQNIDKFLSAEQWQQMCALAKADWEHSLAHDTPLNWCSHR
jgi:hypothetical protein